VLGDALRAKVCRSTHRSERNVGNIAMIILVTNLPAGLLFALIVVLPVCTSYVGISYMRRSTRRPQRSESHNNVAGFIFATVSAIYAVLLGFLIVDVWNQYYNADQAVIQESSAIIGAARTAMALPEPARGKILDRLRSYAEIVINEEWRSDVGLEGSPRALTTINEIWAIYYSVPLDKVDTNMTASLDALSAGREVRLLTNETSMPVIFWVVLVTGGVITISFCFILQMEDTRVHAGLTALLTAIITICLWLILLINHPFSGDFRVTTNAFKHAIYVINSLPR